VDGANPAADRADSPLAGPQPQARPGQRIAVVGACGAGKTYVARALAASLRVPYIGNDAVIWAQFLSRDSILWWACRTFRLRRRQYEALVSDPAWSHLRCLRLRSRRAVDAWLADLARRP
jgi:adenylate kinase family enzyme